MERKFGLTKRYSFILSFNIIFINKKNLKDIIFIDTARHLPRKLLSH